MSEYFKIEQLFEEIFGACMLELEDRQNICLCLEMKEYEHAVDGLVFYIQRRKQKLPKSGLTFFNQLGVLLHMDLNEKLAGLRDVSREFNR